MPPPPGSNRVKMPLSQKSQELIPSAGLLCSCLAVREEVMVVKPKCNYHFWCLQQVENKNFWCFIKNFEKICICIFFCKSWIWNFKTVNLCKKIYKTVLSNTKYQFGMISAFICFIYCPYYFEILTCRKSWKFCIVRWS